MIIEIDSAQLATIVRKIKTNLLIDISKTIEMEGHMNIDLEELLSQYYNGLKIKDESEVIDIQYNYEEEIELESMR